MDLLVPVLLVIAVLALLTKDNFLLFLIALELLVLAINMNFVLYSLCIDDAKGLFIALVLLAMAAIDTTIGLSLLLNYFHLSATGNTQLSQLSNLKG